MADDMQLTKLRSSVEERNEWRSYLVNSAEWDPLIDLRNSDLNGLTLSVIRPIGALFISNLFGYLRKANLELF
jgi:hypothetical protein